MPSPPGAPPLSEGQAANALSYSQRKIIRALDASPRRAVGFSGNQARALARNSRFPPMIEHQKGGLFSLNRFGLAVRQILIEERNMK